MLQNLITVTERTMAERNVQCMGAHRAGPPAQKPSALQCSGELTGKWPEAQTEELATSSPGGQVKGTFEPNTKVEERRVTPDSILGRPQDTPGDIFFFNCSLALTVASSFWSRPPPIGLTRDTKIPPCLVTIPALKLENGTVRMGPLALSLWKSEPAAKHRWVTPHSVAGRWVV